MPNSLECRLGSTGIQPVRARHEPCNRFPVPRNNNLFASLNTVQQGAEGVFCFESANFIHKATKSSIQLDESSLTY